MVKELLRQFNELYVISDMKLVPRDNIDDDPLLTKLDERSVRLIYADVSILEDINFEKNTGVYVDSKLIIRNKDPANSMARIATRARNSSASFVIFPVSKEYASAALGLGEKVSADLGIPLEDMNLRGTRYLIYSFDKK